MTIQDNLKRHDDALTRAIRQRPVAVVGGSAVLAVIAAGVAYLVGGPDLAGGFVVVGALHVTASLLVLATRPR